MQFWLRHFSLFLTISLSCYSLLQLLLQAISEGDFHFTKWRIVYGTRSLFCSSGQDRNLFGPYRTIEILHTRTLGLKRREVVSRNYVLLQFYQSIDKVTESLGSLPTTLFTPAMSLVFQEELMSSQQTIQVPVGRASSELI